MFYDTLVKLCKEHNVKITPLVVSFGVSGSTPTAWKKGASPNSDIVIKLAEYFGVSTDYLLLGKEPELSDRQQQLLNLFNQLSDENQAKIIERAETLLEMQKP